MAVICQCGCNTAIPPSWRHKYFTPRFLAGHSHRGRKHSPETIAKMRNASRRHHGPVQWTGICDCGCGAQTPIATQTNLAIGVIAGFPRRCMPGHRPKASPEVRAAMSRSRKGRTPSAETLAKLSKIRKQIKKSPEWIENAAAAQRGKPKPSLRGENHYNWAGGVSKERRNEWTYQRAWAVAVKRRDNYTCQACGYASKGSRMHAHHVWSYAAFPEKRFDVDNGITLCHACHRAPGVHKTPDNLLDLLPHLTPR